MREAGILLHISSLPGSFGCGDLGSESHRFIDQLQKSGQSYWQILPINPLDGQKGYSPYSPLSAFAGNYLFISQELLIEAGYLDQLSKPQKTQHEDRCDFCLAEKQKSDIVYRAYHLFLCEGTEKKRQRFAKFCSEQAYWLEDWGLFLALYRHHKKPWYEWEPTLRDRDAEALNKARDHFQEEIDQEYFTQFLFHEQWAQLREYCATHGVKLLVITSYSIHYTKLYDFAHAQWAGQFVCQRPC